MHSGILQSISRKASWQEHFLNGEVKRLQPRCDSIWLSDCVLPAVFGCAAACSHGPPWASTAKELIHQVGTQNPGLSVQLSLPPPEFITHFIRAGTRFAVGMNSWGWSSGIWLLCQQLGSVLHQRGCITSPWSVSALTSHLGCLVMLCLYFKTYSPCLPL